MTNLELQKQLEAMRDTLLEGNCDYDARQCKAIGFIMDAIDALHLSRFESTI